MSTPRNEPSERISIAERVEFLCDPAAYPGTVRNVETRETRMSWVFLAGERVYKLKKPMRDRWLDFSTPAARERNAHEEVRLNRRLAANVYLGIARLTVAASGRLSLDGDGEAIDWLVVMRRLSAERMLDHLIETNRVHAGAVDHLANLLAGFYLHARPAERAVKDHIRLFNEQQRVNHEILGHPHVARDLEQAPAALDAIDRFLAHETRLLATRAGGHHIIEGHGDLRAEHICLEQPPVIIDCLEFNRALRLVDPFDELADLALECRRLGAAWIGETLIERCASILGTRPPQRLLDFYTVARACLRARLAVRHLLSSDPRTPDRWLPLAQAHLAAADFARVSLMDLRADRPAIR